MGEEFISGRPFYVSDDQKTGACVLDDDDGNADGDNQEAGAGVAGGVQKSWQQLGGEADRGWLSQGDKRR